MLNISNNKLKAFKISARLFKMLMSKSKIKCRVFFFRRCLAYLLVLSLLLSHVVFFKISLPLVRIWYVDSRLRADAYAPVTRKTRRGHTFLCWILGARYDAVVCCTFGISKSRPYDRRQCCTFTKTNRRSSIASIPKSYVHKSTGRVVLEPSNLVGKAKLARKQQWRYTVG